MKKIAVVVMIMFMLMIVSVGMGTKVYADPDNGNAYGWENPHNPHSSGYTGPGQGGNNGNPPPGPDGNPNQGDTINNTNVINNTINVVNEGDTITTVNNELMEDYEGFQSNAYNQSVNTLNSGGTYQESIGAPLVSGTVDLMDTNSIVTGVAVSPNKTIVKLAKGEFYRFIIAVKADSPGFAYAKTNNSKVVTLIKPVMGFSECSPISYVEVLVTMPHGTYWTENTYVQFYNANNELLAQSRIVLENKYGLDHKSSLFTDSKTTSISHGVTWSNGTSAFGVAVGVRHDREDNSETVYGLVNYDW